MVLQSETDGPSTVIVGELFDEFVRTGSLRPRPERREQLVRTLNGLMACDPVRFIRHILWLTGVRESLEKEVVMALLGGEKADFPSDEELRSRGFDACGDQLLVETLISPEGLDATYNTVNHPINSLLSD